MPPRVLRREADGLLYDVADHRRITIAELREDVQEGRRFRATRHDGVDCTYEVLAEVVSSAGAEVHGVTRSAGAGAIGSLAQAVLGQVRDQARGDRDQARGDQARDDKPRRA